MVWTAPHGDGASADGADARRTWPTGASTRQTHGPSPSADALLDALTSPLSRADSLRHVERMPAREARYAEWPRWINPSLRAALEARGIREPWWHQVQAAQFARAGRDTVIATSTASGKSLAYLMPTLTDIAARSAPGIPGTTERPPRATALYLAPTKALAQDQLQNITRLAHEAGLSDVRADTFDGDTPSEQRRWVRRHANLVLTNPDMLHYGILPGHEDWVHFLRALRYIIVDECHVYRGVFGAHVSMVLRRLARIARYYRADPTFILASATSATPEVSASRLVGRSVTAVTEDGSPRNALTVALWEPGIRDLADGKDPREAVREAERERALAEEQGVGAHIELRRRPAPTESGALLADLVMHGAQTLVFTRARRSSELVATGARRIIHSAAEQQHSAPLADLSTRIAAYRGGYLAEERRALEQGLRAGELRGLASTNALELGIDMSGLDAVVVTGWPGTRASLWQQFGRVGRSHGELASGGLAIFVAREDPLDTYVVAHPESVFGVEVEAAVFDPSNPYVMTPHLCAAAAELPLRDGEEEIFGPTSAELLGELVDRGILRRRPHGWYWTLERRAHDLTDLRGSGGEAVRIVDAPTGQLIGTVDAASAHRTVHDGAVYLHQGVSYVVDHLDVDGAVAMVHREKPQHTTHPEEQSSIRVRQVRRSERWGSLTLCFGEVEVTDQVTGYQVRDVFTQAVLAQRPLDLPASRLVTTAVWFEIPQEVLERIEIDPADVPGALHAAEHAQISMLPLLATCDRWDIGGVSTALHIDTETATIFVYDGAAGGAGFAERGYESAPAWVRATADMIDACTCASGCPACVVSPKCGNGNEPLSKAHALTLLMELARLAPQP